MIQIRRNRLGWQGWSAGRGAQRLALQLASVVALAGCGGGGGGSPAPVPSSDASLASLVLSYGALAPAFAPATTAYDCVLSFNTPGVTFTATPTQPGAALRFEGSPIASGVETSEVVATPAPLPYVFEVTAPDGLTTSSTTITLSRQAVPGVTYAKASNTGGNDLFGSAVALSGDTLVVGAQGEASASAATPADNSLLSAGAVYVFVFDGSTWSQQALLKASNPGAGDFFGASVALAGDTLVVGAPGEDSSSTGVNGVQADELASGSGAAYVFVRSGTTWSQQAYLKASNTGVGDDFGRSVDVRGDVVLVGAPGEDSSATGVGGNGADNSAANSGAAYTFTRSGSVWSPGSYLKASNTGANDEFGQSVSVGVNVLAVGAPKEDSAATGIGGDQLSNTAADSGAAYVFIAPSGVPAQQAYLKASNAGAGDEFGRRVAVSQLTVLVGAPLEDSSATLVNGNGADNSLADSGAAYVFRRTATVWAQEAYLKAGSPGTLDQFGQSVGLDGSVAVVGADQEDGGTLGVNGSQADDTAPNAGAGYLYLRSGTLWSSYAYLKGSYTGASDALGFAVAVSGATVVLGAPAEDSNATGVGGDGANDLSAGSGAVFLYR